MVCFLAKIRYRHHAALMITRHPLTNESVIGILSPASGPEVAAKIALKPSNALRSMVQKLWPVSRIVATNPMIGRMSQPPMPDGPGAVRPLPKLIGHHSHQDRIRTAMPALRN